MSDAAAEILIGVAGPMTGKNAWFGEQMQQGAAFAVADVNAAGGVLGEQVRVVAADDFCDPEQAFAAAKKLVGEGVTLVTDTTARMPRSSRPRSTRRRGSS